MMYQTLVYVAGDAWTWEIISVELVARIGNVNKGPVILTFFGNSVCFKWFWFGLEILRPVYKWHF